MTRRHPRALRGSNGFVLLAHRADVVLHAQDGEGQWERERLSSSSCIELTAAMLTHRARGPQGNAHRVAELFPPGEQCCHGHSHGDTPGMSPPFSCEGVTVAQSRRPLYSADHLAFGSPWGERNLPLWELQQRGCGISRRATPGSICMWDAGRGEPSARLSVSSRPLLRWQQAPAAR